MDEKEKWKHQLSKTYATHLLAQTDFVKSDSTSAALPAQRRVAQDDRYDL